MLWSFEVGMDILQMHGALRQPTSEGCSFGWFFDKFLYSGHFLTNFCTADIPRSHQKTYFWVSAGSSHRHLSLIILTMSSTMHVGNAAAAIFDPLRTAEKRSTPTPRSAFGERWSLASTNILEVSSEACTRVPRKLSPRWDETTTFLGASDESVKAQDEDFRSEKRWKSKQ